MKQMKGTQRPVGQTVNGKAELVMQDAESYQTLLEAAIATTKEAGIATDRSEIERKVARLPETVYGAQTDEKVAATRRMTSLDWTKLLDALEGKA